MQKYGFVYLWFDRKHKRYYVGAHWGSVEDGYICSSSWMKRAYKLRPQDFKRRIIKTNLETKLEMFNEEQRFLNMIKKEEISPHTETPRYYNLRTISTHWSSCEDKVKSLSEKISIKTKEAMQRPDVKEKTTEGYKKRQYTISAERKSEISKKMWEEKSPKEKRYKPLKKNTSELNEVYRQKSKEMWQNRTIEQKQEITNKIKEANRKTKEIRSAKMSATKWYNNGVINIRKAISPGPEWVLGRI